MNKFKRLIRDFLYTLFPNYYYRKALKQNRQAEEACRVYREKMHQANVEEWKNNPDNEEEEAL